MSKIISRLTTRIKSGELKGEEKTAAQREILVRLLEKVHAAEDIAQDLYVLEGDAAAFDSAVGACNPNCSSMAYYLLTSVHAQLHALHCLLRSAARPASVDLPHYRMPHERAEARAALGDIDDASSDERDTIDVEFIESPEPVSAHAATDC